VFILCNSFSINMLDRKRGAGNIAFIPINKAAAKNLIVNHSREGNFMCAIGREDVAIAVAISLDLDVAEYLKDWIENARASPTITIEGNSLIIAQYRGDKLPKDAKHLPPNATIEYWQVYRYP